MQPHLNHKPLSANWKTTITNTVASLPSIPDNAIFALVQVEAQAIRARFDNTSSVTGGVGGGLLLPVSDVNNPWYRFEGYGVLTRMRMYRNTGSDGSINVIYFGEGQPD